MATICSNLVQAETKLFSKQSAVILIIDKYREVVKLLHQRSWQSATRLSGTHKMAIKIRPYSNTEFDDIKIDIKCNVKQVYPSPAMMADYKNGINMSDAVFYLNHSTCDPFSAPCCNGSCVRAYADRRDNSTWIYHLVDVFEEDTPDKEMPPTLNRDELTAFSELIREKEVQKVLIVAKQMQKQVRQI
jgi:hypothetical protein